MIQTSMTGAFATIAAQAAQATKQAPVDPVAAAAKAKQKAELEKVAKNFEAIFVRKMVSTMRSASGGESIDGSAAVDQFQEMSDAKMADNLAEHGGLGIAQMLLSQLDKKS